MAADALTNLFAVTITPGNEKDSLWWVDSQCRCRSLQATGWNCLMSIKARPENERCMQLSNIRSSQKHDVYRDEKGGRAVEATLEME
jgi:hypothetical protein